MSHAGITTGVPKGSSRESRAALSRSNIGLRESLSRLRYLDYDNGTDSETYSADSYNSSDESADSASEIDARDGEVDEAGTLFCTPDPQPDNSHARSVRVAQGSSMPTDDHSVAEQRLFPVRARRPGALRRVTKSRQIPRLEATTRLSMPATPPNAGSAARSDDPPSVRKDAANDRGPFSHYDRSSSMSAPRPGQDRLPAASDDSQEFGGGDDFWDGVGLTTEDVDPVNHGESIEAELSKSARLAAKVNLSPASETTSTISQPVLQSIETGDRHSTPANVTNNLSTDSPRTSASTMSKKRASSQPPMHERPSRRSLTSSSFDSMYSLTPGRALPKRLNLSHTSGQVKEEVEEVKREFTHPGCVSHRPCVHPSNFTVRSGRPLVTVYGNEVDGSPRQMTLGQAEFIISHCTCHWANGFTEVWADAQGKFGDMWKAEVLLGCFPGDLWRAARECCPRRPGHFDCIVIDDD
jgi:hypothetical protein